MSIGGANAFFEIERVDYTIRFEDRCQLRKLPVTWLSPREVLQVNPHIGFGILEIIEALLKHSI